MANRGPVIKEVAENETLEEYYGRYKYDELEQILQNPKAAQTFCSTLLNCNRQPTDALMDIWKEVRRLKNYERLQHFLQMLKRDRPRLLDSLTETAECIEVYAKRGSFARLVGSTTDILGTFGGILLEEFNFGYSNWAFRAATSFGFVGFLATVAQMYLSRRICDDLNRSLRKDQDRFDPIRKWFQQSEKLENAMQAVFPFDMTEEIIQNFITKAEEEFSGINLLEDLLTSLAVKRDVNSLRDPKLIGNAVALATNPETKDLREWILNQYALRSAKKGEASKLDRLYYNVYVYIPAFFPKGHHTSIFLAARMFLNFLTLLDIIHGNTEVAFLANEMRDIKEHLGKELAAMVRITKYIESKRNQIDQHQIQAGSSSGDVSD